MIAWTPFAAGLAAGLGIALPLGAIGVLIVREGVERGIRAAGVAALAVASVDFGYALVAVVVGDRIADALSGVERVVQVVGALALTTVVVLGVRDLLRSVRAAPGVTQPSELPELPVGYHRTFLRFVGLTAINPMTAVYFVALTAGLSQRLSGQGRGGVRRRCVPRVAGLADGPRDRRGDCWLADVRAGADRRLAGGVRDRRRLRREAGPRRLNAHRVATAAICFRFDDPLLKSRKQIVRTEADLGAADSADSARD